MEDKPDCYKCEYRGGVPGSAHSSCTHPSVIKEDNMFAQMVNALSGKNNAAIEKLGIKGNAHGVRRGWFVWPANFDPVWLKSCNGFKEKAV